MKRIFLLILITSSVLSAIAQSKYYLDNSKSSLIIEGTSSVHDWEMEANDLKSDMMVRFNGQKIEEITDASFSSPADQVLSDNSIMNSKTHKALKADDYSIISFNLRSVSGLNVNGSNISGQAIGVVKIAGVSKTIRVSFNGKVNGDRSISIQGTVPLKMTDFKIDPPTAMLGALKTGDNVKINYNFLYKNR
ncbi:MAG: YceI family protein [Bacteroidota bacterium]